MNKENQQLLDEVIKSKLEETMSETDDEKSRKAFNDAINGIKTQSELDKVKVEAEKVSNETKKARKDRILKGIEIGVIILVPIIEVACRKSYAKDICNFEKDYTFTTSAGKGLSSLFRFK